MTSALAPQDFRLDLTDDEIDAIAADESRRIYYETIWRQCQWGLSLKSLGIDPKVMCNDDFDPADFGIAKRARPTPRIV
jgi:hypothetical protein